MPRAPLWLIAIALLIAAVRQSSTPANAADPDLWWHLRTGHWILNHGLPQTDPFATTGRPLVAYSWLYEVGLAGLDRLAGLRFIPIYTSALWLAIVAAMLSLPVRAEYALAMSAFFLAAAGNLSTPRPWLFSMLLFLLMARLLERRSWWIVALFALWANLHIQFVYGLFVLGCFTLVNGTWRLLAACCAATLANPYHFKLYGVILEYSMQGSLSRYITELQPPDPFNARTLLLIAGLIAAAIGLYCKRRGDVFGWLLLAASAAISLRSRRDAWFLAISVIVIWARMLPGKALLWRPALATAAVLMLIPLSLPTGPIADQMRRNLPVAAADFIQNLPGPVYSTFDWGGYLIFRRGERSVYIDGRTNVHDVARLTRFFEAWKGNGWEADPDLRDAKLIVAPADMPLTAILRERRKVLYEDDVAVVFQ